MNRRKLTLLYIIMLAIIIIIFVYKKTSDGIDCFLFKKRLSNYLKENNIKNVTQIFFLFGHTSTICSTCPIGRKILSALYDKDAIYIFPDDYSYNDIEIFRLNFPVADSILVTNEDWKKIIYLIMGCLRIKSVGKNIILEIDKKGKVEHIYIIE